MSYILLVEDDLEIATTLLRFLKVKKFETKHLTSGEHVIATIKETKPDIVLLDVMIPVVNGVECCKLIREFSDVPVILLTAKVEEEDRVIGLESGADDYVCKPFSAMELILRIKAILKRGRKNLFSNTFTVNIDTYKLTYKEKNTELTHLEFSLFNLLYKQPERVFSRTQILEFAYPDMRDISDRTIDAHVKNIRKKIKGIGISNAVIESVYGAGYRFVAPSE
ncbi:response regulator [Thalassomonas viridans]|uniref:Response regulator n=1 Tax=Thalassomonas viridans TaxID=137584 RepID=A0AAE9ZCS0_9GAMM|nr:response regulator [Thalassomonas viridans]WDE08693.1 response regulator [Thalassomonas viridans]